MTELAPGTTFAGYRIEGPLGQGGMGVVYRATQIALDRIVALKVIAPQLAQDENFRERFQRESRTAASIEHPHVVPVHEAGEHEGVLFISMRFIEGTDLRALLREHGALEPERAVRIISQVASALDAAHARGLVHRDVKPANILLASGGEDHAYLTDFGLTKHTESAGGLTGTGQFVGTLDYMAPEQIKGEPVDGRADVYALGCVLHELLTGAPPFVRDSEVAKLWAHTNEPPPEPPGPLGPVVTRAMAKDPADRHPSAGDLGRAAQAALAGTAVDTPEHTVAAGDAAPRTRTASPAPTAVGEQPRSSRAMVVAGAVALVLVTAGAALALSGAFSKDEDLAPARTVEAGGPAGQPGTPLTRSAVIEAVNGFADDYEDENLLGIEESVAPEFTYENKGGYCVGDTTAADLDRSLTEFSCQFEKLLLPEMKLTNIETEIAGDRAEAHYDYELLDDGKRVESGRGTATLVSGKEFPLISSIVVEPAG